MTTKSYSLIVIGAGPAGYSAAIRAKQSGAQSVLLVEKERAGGTCLNRGCVPTKFLWEAVTLAKKIKNAQNYGIKTQASSIDFSELQSKRSKLIDMNGKGLGALLKSYAIELVEGSAKFVSANSIEITAVSGVTTASAEKILIATGSLPKSIPGIEIDHNKFIDSTDILNLTEVPKTLLVIGGGAIGVEFSGIFSELGCEVTLVEKENQLLPLEDPELAEEVKKSLQKQGVAVFTGVGTLDEHIAKAQKVLVATGRKPNIETLNLESAGIKYSKKGIDTDSHFETSAKGVYAAGDVAGYGLYAYTAQAEGIIAASNAMGNKITSELPPIPRVVFSTPPAASVGAGENHRPAGNIVVGRFPFSANSMAAIEASRAGWVKIVANKENGRILAGSIFGADAHNLITIIALAIKQKATLADMSREMFFHPSLAEAVHGACEDALGKCVDLPGKKQV